MWCKKSSKPGPPVPGVSAAKMADQVKRKNPQKIKKKQALVLIAYPDNFVGAFYICCNGDPFGVVLHMVEGRRNIRWMSSLSPSLRRSRTRCSFVMRASCPIR